MVGVGLLLKQREQGRGEADGAEQVGGDDGFGVGEVRGFEVFGAHDARVLDDDVQGRVVLLHLCREVADAGGVFDIERGGLHAGVRRRRLVEDALAAAGDDDLIAEGVKGFGESATDARAAAGDQDGVAGDIHDDVPLVTSILWCGLSREVRRRREIVLS